MASSPLICRSCAAAERSAGAINGVLLSLSALPAGPTIQAAKSSAACAFELRALIDRPETLIGLTATLPIGNGAIAHLNGSFAASRRLAKLLTPGSIAT